MNRYWLPPQLKEGCVLFIPWEVSGTTAYDASGNGNNGTLVNSPTKTRGGLYGYEGLKFNGSNQTSQFDFPNVTWDWTLSFNVNSPDMNSSSWKVGIGLCETSPFENTNHYFILGNSTDAYRCAFLGYNWSSFASVQANPRLSANVSYRITMRYSSWEMRLYVNWVSQWVASSWTLRAFNRMYLMCARPPYDYSAWVTSNVLIHNRALSADEIRLDASMFFIP